MQYYNYSENKQRGTFDFPFELYHVDSSHARYVMSYLTIGMWNMRLSAFWKAPFT